MFAQEEADPKLAIELEKNFVATGIPKLRVDFEKESASLAQSEIKLQPEDFALQLLVNELDELKKIFQTFKNTIERDKAYDEDEDPDSKAMIKEHLLEAIEAVKKLKKDTPEILARYTQLEEKLHPKSDDLEELNKLKNTAFENLNQTILNFIDCLKSISFDKETDANTLGLFKKVLKANYDSITESLKDFISQFPDKTPDSPTASLKEKLETIKNVAEPLNLPKEPDIQKKATPPPKSETPKPKTFVEKLKEKAGLADKTILTLIDIPEEKSPIEQAKQQIAYFYNEAAAIESSHAPLIKEYYEKKAEQQRLITSIPPKHPDLIKETLRLITKLNTSLDISPECEAATTAKLNLDKLLKLHPEHQLVLAAIEKLEPYKKEYEDNQFFKNALGSTRLLVAFPPDSKLVQTAQQNLISLSDSLKNQPEFQKQIALAGDYLNRLLKLLPESQSTTTLEVKESTFLHEYLNYDLTQNILPSLPESKDLDLQKTDKVKPWLNSAISQLQRRNELLKTREEKVVPVIEAAQKVLDESIIQLETYLEKKKKESESKRVKSEKRLADIKKLLGEPEAAPNPLQNKKKEALTSSQLNKAVVPEKPDGEVTQEVKTEGILEKTFKALWRKQPERKREFSLTENFSEAPDFPANHLGTTTATNRKEEEQNNKEFRLKRKVFIKKVFDPFDKLFTEFKKDPPETVSRSNPFLASFRESNKVLKREFTTIQKTYDNALKEEVSENVSKDLETLQKNLFQAYAELDQKVSAHNSNYDQLINYETRGNFSTYTASKQAMTALEDEFFRIANKKMKSWESHQRSERLTYYNSQFRSRNLPNNIDDGFKTELNTLDPRLIHLYSIHLTLKKLNHGYRTLQTSNDVTYRQSIKNCITTSLHNDQMPQISEKKRFCLFRFLRNALRNLDIEWETFKDKVGTWRANLFADAPVRLPKSPTFFEDQKTRWNSKTRDKLVEIRNNALSKLG